MSYADVNGICLFYEEHGSARSVARSAIRPSHTHDIFASPDLAAVVIPFLDAPSLQPPAPFGQ